MPAAKQPDQPSFEDAVSRLESIVDSMEQGQVPLAELISRYEEGSKLLKICEARLKDAELKIDQLKQTRDTVALESFSPERAER
jgi:exodeoxyribonuclease VII small subunit